MLHEGERAPRARLLPRSERPITGDAGVRPWCGAPRDGAAGSAHKAMSNGLKKCRAFAFSPQDRVCVTCLQVYLIAGVV